MNVKLPNPDGIFPHPKIKDAVFIKSVSKNPNIIAGDFSYISDTQFESHVSHLFDENGDKLIIGKFCQFAKGVEFVMNGANHQMDCASTYPFYLGHVLDTGVAPDFIKNIKGNTIVGNDVWIGQNATILPGVHIGDGAIIGLNSVVGTNVEPYSIYAGNPARFLKYRFDKELIDLLLEYKWWDKNIEKINEIIPVLTNSNTDEVKSFIKNELENKSHDCR